MAFPVAADDHELFCSKRFAALKWQSTAALKDAPYHNSIDVLFWKKHTGGEHPVCRGVKLKGGGQKLVKCQYHL